MAIVRTSQQTPAVAGLPADLREGEAHAPRHVSWSSLGLEARAFRVAHTAWSVAGLASLGYIWTCAARRRRNRRLWAGVAFLLGEGAALIVGRGNCPFGPMQAKMGDPVPLFELVLPPRAAKAAIPILTLATLAGLVALVARRPATRDPRTPPRARA
jgi:hypothetical protein